MERYVLLMTGKKNSYAAMQLANQKYDYLFAMMEVEGSEFDPQIVEFLFTQLTSKAAMKWGTT